MYLFGSKSSIALKRLKTITLQKQSNYPRSLLLESGGTDWFGQNLTNGVFEDIAWKKKLRLNKHELYNRANELRLSIAPNTLRPNYWAINTEKKLATCFYFLKDIDLITMISNSLKNTVMSHNFLMWKFCGKTPVSA